MVVAAELLRPLTIEDLAEFPDDGMRREIVTGELVVTPAPTPVHQIISGRLITLLTSFVEKNQLGFVFPAPVDVRLSPHDIVEPDIVYVSNERKRFVLAKYIDGPPDIVIEVLSPATRRMDLVRKRALYARSGIAEYWIIDPERRTLEMHRLENGMYQVIASEQGVYRSVVISGLSVDSAALFRSLPDP
jgi:Uma2 family endonuclease